MHVGLTIVGLAFAVYFVTQCRKPTGWLGRSVVSGMNIRHASLTSWALEGVTIDRHRALLDIGCGGGGTVRRFAEQFSTAKVYGVDYSAASTAASRRANAASAEAGRVLIVRGSASHLPFADASFDLVSAFETHYYWPNLDAAFVEVRRVLAPGGVFVLGVEAYKKGFFASYMLILAMKLLGGRILTVDEHRELLVRAGLSDVRVDTQPSRGWLRAVGRRPSD
jgi:ubiquinone/menaquinone biosynthesis C-methylase UbiE